MHFCLVAVITCQWSSVTSTEMGGREGGRRKRGRRKRGRHEGPKSLAGVLMGVTMTTKDPLGEGGSERTSFELWKVVIV